MRKNVPLLWWILPLLVAAALRFAMAWYNTEANDNHLEVVRLLMQGKFPIVGDCWQCYHPKQFHLLGAGVLSLFQITDPLLQWRGLQLINALLSTGTLTYLLLFLRGEERWAPWNFFAFALWVSNPKFAGISVQATNDTLVILASTAFFFHGWMWLKGAKFHRLPMALAAGVAMATKGSGLALVLLLLALLAVRYLQQWRGLRLSHHLSAAGVALLLAVMVATASLAGYWQNSRKASSPFALNLPADPFPSLYKEELTDRAGVSSILHSFFRLPLVSLLQDPMIVGGSTAPAHRSSFWAQLWGRHSSPRFDHYPGVWQSSSPVVLAVVRLQILFQTAAAFLLLSGLVYQSRTLWRKWRQKAPSERWMAQAFFLLGLLGILALVIKLNLTYRSYFTMKAIYLYPALLPAAWLLMRGGHYWANRLPTLGRALAVPIALLLLLGPLDSLLLAHDLANSYGQQVERLGAAHTLKTRGQPLTEFPVIHQHQGWGALQTITPNRGNPITAGGLRWSSGFTGHAPSFIQFDLPPGRYHRFDFQVAKEDLHPTGDGVQFAVITGADTLWKSSIIRYLDRQSGSIELPDTARTLILTVDPLGNRNGDHIAWLAPQLYPAAAPLAP